MYPQNVKRKVTDEVQVMSQPIDEGNIEIRDSIRLRGIVKVVVEELDSNGKTIERVVHHKNNLVVDLGKEVLCKLITAPQNNMHITTLKLGTKGYDLTNTSKDAYLIPVAPKSSDASLIDTATTFTKDFDGFTMYPTDSTKTEVQFSVVIEANEANSSDSSAVNGAKPYTEAGMYTKGGVLFARETFPAIVKTVNRRITFTWSILF